MPPVGPTKPHEAVCPRYWRSTLPLLLRLARSGPPPLAPPPSSFATAAVMLIIVCERGGGEKERWERRPLPVAE